jgi:ubiquinone/menaquinone biosynthesis C-methylase UbiE
MSQSHGEEAESYIASLERMNRFQEPVARRLIADLNLPAGSTGLDVGCGAGLYSTWLAEAIGPAGRVLGIEADAEIAEVARARFKELEGQGQVEVRDGDGTRLDLDDHSVDWLWCGDVLHHMLETETALRELSRVVRPGGRIIVKESQVLSALFLPGHPELERRLQLAEIERTRDEGGGRPFLERRQTTPASMRAAGLSRVTARTYLLESRAPLEPAAHDYVAHSVFARNWGERLRPLLSVEDWEQRSALCEADSPRSILRDPDYYCLYPISVWSAVVVS